MNRRSSDPGRSTAGRSEAVLRRIQELLEGTSARLAGLELVDLSVVHEGRRTVIRVFVDRDAPGVEPGRGGGITIEDCSRVSRMLGDYLDGDPEMAPLMEQFGAYALEVSSPGIDRPLKKPEHFSRFRGQTAAVTTTEKILGRLNHLGRIAEVGEEALVLDQPDLGRTEIRFAEIRLAHLKVDPWQVAREAQARLDLERQAAERRSGRGLVDEDGDAEATPLLPDVDAGERVARGEKGRGGARRVSGRRAARTNDGAARGSQPPILNNPNGRARAGETGTGGTSHDRTDDGDIPRSGGSDGARASGDSRRGHRGGSEA